MPQVRHVSLESEPISDIFSMGKIVMLKVGDVVYSKRHRTRVSVEDVNGEAVVCVWIPRKTNCTERQKTKEG